MLSPFTSYFLTPLLAPRLSTPLLQFLHTSLMQITVNSCQISPHLICRPPWNQGNPSKMQVKDKLMIRTDFATFILYSVQWILFFLKTRSLPSWSKDPSERHWRIRCLLLLSHLSSLLYAYPHSDSSRKMSCSVWTRDLCPFPLLKASYAVFFNWITFTWFSGLRWNAAFFQEDLLNTPHS